MIVTVFRSRLEAEAQQDYVPMARRLGELAKTMPGYVSHKVFVAEDGERLTLVEFASEDGLQAWATHPGHVEAKRQGIRRLFACYRVQICKVIKDSGLRVRDARRASGASSVSDEVPSQP